MAQLGATPQSQEHIVTVQNHCTPVANVGAAALLNSNECQQQIALKPLCFCTCLGCADKIYFAAPLDVVTANTVP